jgi:hypothetical protein
LKAAPPQPGWIERLYRGGVGLAIPVTIIAGVVLLLTAREQQSAAPAAGINRNTVISVPLQDTQPSVTLHRDEPARCTARQPGDRRCPTGTAPPGGEQGR